MSYRNELSKGSLSRNKPAESGTKGGNEDEELDYRKALERRRLRRVQDKREKSQELNFDQKKEVFSGTTRVERTPRTRDDRKTSGTTAVSTSSKNDSTAKNGTEIAKKPEAEKRGRVEERTDQQLSSVEEKKAVDPQRRALELRQKRIQEDKLRLQEMRRQREQRRGSKDAELMTSSETTEKPVATPRSRTPIRTEVKSSARTSVAPPTAIPTTRPREVSIAPYQVAPPAATGGVKDESSQPVAYVGFANLPHQVHRKSVKKGFEFTLMVAGESGLGKSTLVNSLFLTSLYADREIPAVEDTLDQTVQIEASTVEIEERGVKLRLTIVDTPGYGDALDCSECFQPIVNYVDDQFEQYLREERGFNRRHITDSRVHACFYFISSTAHGLKPIDIEFMKSIHHKVNIVPVIAKSDMLTKSEIAQMKARILQEIAENGINIYNLPEADDDEDEEFKNQTTYLKAGIPFAIVGSTDVIEVNGKKVRGRVYPWGVVEVDNPDHCDFLKLRTMLVTHMQDLQEVTHDIHYERYRAERLKHGEVEDLGPPPTTPGTKSALEAKDAELRRMQEMIRKMQLQMQQQAGDGDELPATTNQSSAPNMPRASRNVISKQV